MMQLSCPCCGARDENEFVCGGTSHIARPPLSASDAVWGHYLFFRDNPKGVHLRALAARVRLRPWFNLARHTVTHEMLAVYADDRAAAALAGDGSVQCLSLGRARRRRIDRSQPLGVQLQRRAACAASPATRSRRRCSPTACAWSAAASSCTGRAASCPAASRSRARWWTWAQGARRTPNVRATLLPLVARACARQRQLLAERGVRRSVRSPACFAALLPAGFYYKTFKWPSWQLFEPAIRRMAGLGRAPREPDRGPLRGDRGGSRRAGGRRRPRRACGRRGGRARGGGHAADDERRATRRGARLAQRSAKSAHSRRSRCSSACGCCPHGRLRRLRSQPRVRLRDAWRARAPRDLPRGRAARAAVEDPCPHRDRGGGCVRAAADLSGQRPPGRDAGGRGRTAMRGAYGVACGRRVVIAAASDRAYALARSAGALRARDCRHRRCAARRPMSACTCTAPAHRRRASRRCRRPRRARLYRVAAGRSRAAFDCDLILTAGGLCARRAPALPGRRASCAGCTRAPCSSPTAPLPGLWSVGACAGIFEREHAARARRAGRRGAARGAAPPAAPPGAPGIGGGHRGGARRARQAVRRPAERCVHERRRARGARELSLGRAPEALHDHRHGHRPGQDQQRQRAAAHGCLYRAARPRRWARRAFARRSCR